MARLGAVLVIATVGWGALGCSSSSPIDGARQSWKRTLETCATYHYAVTDTSFSGFSARTTIVISDGQPIARGYVQTQGFGPNQEVTASWIEEAGHIGEHAEGRPAKTMEQLQDDCARQVLTQDPSKNQVKFSADDRGVLLECWYVPKGCADDCVMGVVVEDFACGTFVLGDGGATDAVDAHDAGAPQDADALVSDVGDSLVSDAGDSSVDPDALTCEPDPLFYCLLGAPGGPCGDTGRHGVCVNGVWTCPPGMIRMEQCGPCSGTPPPPPCHCSGTGWVCPAPDAGSG